MAARPRDLGPASRRPFFANPISPEEDPTQGVIHDPPRQSPRGDVMMAVQMAVEAAPRREAVATGLAVERSPVVVKRRPPQVMTPRLPVVKEVVRDARGLVLPVMTAMSAIRPMCVPVLTKVAVFSANARPAAAFFGTRAPIAVIGRCERGSRQQDRGQSHHRDHETRSVLLKYHGEPPFACSDGFDARRFGKFSGGPRSPFEEKHAENARKSLRRESI
jgi:hypothetical protein